METFCFAGLGIVYLVLSVMDNICQQLSRVTRGLQRCQSLGQDKTREGGGQAGGEREALRVARPGDFLPSPRLRSERESTTSRGRTPRSQSRAAAPLPLDCQRRKFVLLLAGVAIRRNSCTREKRGEV